MANDLEQRAKELWIAEHRHDAGRVTAIKAGLLTADDRRALRAIAAALQQAQAPRAQAVAYGYFAKGSGNLVIVEEKVSFLPHVFPLYAAPPPLPEGVSEEDVEAAAAASGLPVRFPNDRKRVVDALESYRARLATKGGIVKA